MKKYSELIKLPVKYPTKSDQKAFKDENRSLDRYRKKEYIVTASVAEETLIVDIFEQGAKTSWLVFRHFYDKTDKKYVTQKVDKGKKGTGAIYTYCWDGLSVYADGVEKIILDYLGAEDVLTGLQAINKEEQKILGAKRQERYDKITKIIDARMAVIPDKPPAEFFDWIRDTVYLNARYFIYTRDPKAKEQSGRCTFCKTYFAAPAKNGKTTVCPECGSILRCCSKGRCGDEIDHWNNVSYVERVTDTDGKPAIVERVFYTKFTIRNIRRWETALHSELYTSEVERRFYNPDNEFTSKSNEAGEYHYYEDVFLQSNEERWCSNNQGNPIWRGGISVYPDNLNNIVGSTDCQLKNVEISVVARNVTGSFSKLYTVLKKVPAIENLVKQGLTNLANEVLNSCDVYYGQCNFYNSDFRKHIKPDGRSAAEFLCVSRPEVVRFAEINVTSREYSIYMEAKEAFETAELGDIHALCAEYDECDDNALIEIMRYGVRPQKIVSYLAKQERLRRSDDSLAITFRDYLKVAKRLYGSLNADTRYPADLVKEHDRVTVLYNEQKDAIHANMLAKRVKLLEALDFSDKDFTIFPLRTADDFINESKLLKHCVKTYITQCSEGCTNIFALRRTSEPEKPYFTVNIANDGHLIQNRGLGNCAPPEEVKRFVNKWLKIVKKKLIEMSLVPGVTIKPKTVNQFRIGA